MAEGEGEKAQEDPNVSLGKVAIKNFCEASTIHGISPIFSANNAIIRLFWVGMFVTVCSLLLWEVLELVKKLTSNDVVMTTRRLPEKMLEFPVVIVSNADPYSKAKLTKFPERENGTGKLEHLRDILSNLSRDEARDIGSYLGHTCKFGEISCFVSRLAIPWIGNSLRFNTDGSWKQKNPGPEYGLQMTLEINESDYSNTFDNGQGVVIKIGSAPMVIYSLQHNKGVVASPGTLTKIKMRKRRIIRLPHPYPDDCQKDAAITEMKGFHFKFPLSRFYSLDFCTFLAMFRNQMTSCGVVDPEYRFIFEGSIVMEKSNVSFNISGNKSEVKNIYSCLKRVASETTVGDCKPPCIDEEFDFTISHLRWPSTEEAKEKLKVLKGSEVNGSMYRNWTLDSIYKNMLKISIYYSDFNIEIVEQKAAYRLVEFASDMGGQIGLWIGASVYSAFEVWSLLVSLAFYFFRSVCQRTCVNDIRSTSTEMQEA